MISLNISRKEFEEIAHAVSSVDDTRHVKGRQCYRIHFRWNIVLLKTKISM